ncbi:hypothetical protein BP5796_10881 [Coleophoma crateriformis]|uniref:Uncharacterized protein n=1 Tax=Coleophoma crateriformis TaxID=565419 RepID=A0A3D8QLA8_9HELO|nr:hypothetical protein BP5796_10881 [Coleophoma crateriformis]
MAAMLSRFTSLLWLCVCLASSSIAYAGSRQQARRFASDAIVGGMLGARQQVNSTGANSTLVATDTFSYQGETWAVYEDLTQADGIMTFVSEGGVTRVFDRRLEATTTLVNGTVASYFGLNSSEVNLALNDILADELLKNGEPVEAAVRDVVPFSTIANWDTFLGNVQANDTMRLSSRSATRNYYPLNHLPASFWADTNYVNWTFDGLVGGWMPASRKIYRRGPDVQDWFEIIAFGDVDATDPNIIHVWFRSTWVLDGAVKLRGFTKDYPQFAPALVSPAASQFYVALLRFAEYWEQHLEDLAALSLPDQSWVDITKHTFALELIQRYHGVYPKYGAYDRDYAGSEYDGFQDIFTSSVTSNLLWGRFDQARSIIENYFELFVSDSGDINMRGPEIPQFGMSLSLLTRYAQYTGDTALLQKYKSKILAWVNILTTRHDESLQLPTSNSSYGLIAGWSESDSSLAFNPDFYTRPYWNNNAFSARGLKDLSKLSMFSEYAAAWTQRAEQMINQTVDTLTRNIRTDMSPPYVPVLPDMNLTILESIAQESPSPQAWPHRVFAELLHAAVLPSNLTDTTINSMRAYGITSLGIVANVGGLYAESRDILGFISYGYALALLLQDRIDEFVLFLYAHRYHVHSRGQWIPGEVTSTGIYEYSGALYCMPAGHSLPILMRAALVFEHPDDEVLFLGRGVPVAWLATGEATSIAAAPTRWGQVGFAVQLSEAKRAVTATVQFVGAGTVEARVKLRVPDGETVKGVSVNGKNSTLVSGDEVVFSLGPPSQNISVIAFY